MSLSHGCDRCPKEFTTALELLTHYDSRHRRNVTLPSGPAEARRPAVTGPEAPERQAR